MSIPVSLRGDFKASQLRALARKTKDDMRYDLIVIDELGYLPFSQPGGQLLFHLISKLYENTSLLITDHHQSRLRRLAATSAMCTHIGCHLHWNSFETCWDCPCHSSQFAVDGTALNAPAIRALDEVKTEE